VPHLHDPLAEDALEVLSRLGSLLELGNRIYRLPARHAHLHGAQFLQVAGQLNRDRSPKAAIRLFSFSITYLGLLFAAIAVDAVVQQRF
jgi:heme O synthase-like polyprenyltransferase